MNHRLLLRFALLMWGVPLLAAILALSGYLFLRGPLFVAIAPLLAIAARLCAAAGAVAVLLILFTRNRTPETPRHSRRRRARVVLVLLALNLPVIAGYGLIVRSLHEPVPVLALPSPGGEYLAEVILLGARALPAYGLGVTLRATPGHFFHQPRTVVFSAYCLKGPTLAWTDNHRLLVGCEGVTAETRRLERYRDIVLDYRISASPVQPRR